MRGRRALSELDLEGKRERRFFSPLCFCASAQPRGRIPGSKAVFRDEVFQTLELPDASSSDWFIEKDRGRKQIGQVKTAGENWIAWVVLEGRG